MKQREYNNVSVIATSAIIPNVKDGLSVKNYTSRLSDLVNALSYHCSELREHSLSDFSVIDASKARYLKEHLKPYIDKINRDKICNVNLLIPSYSKNVKENCLKFGKGFAELELINEFFDTQKCMEDGHSIIKISGRYKIMNITDFYHFSRNHVFEKDEWFACPVSNLLSNCNSVVLIINAKYWDELYQYLKCHLDDSKGAFLERGLYSLYRKGHGVRIRNFPLFDALQLSGSTGQSYSGLKHFFRTFLYKFL